MKIAIYPFNENVIPLLEEISKNYEEIFPVYLKGTVPKKSTLGMIYNSNNIYGNNLIACQNIDELLCNVETLFLPEIENSRKVYEEIVRVLKKAIDLQINVVCAAKLENDILELLKEKLENKFVYLLEKNNELNCRLEYNALKEIKSFVIGIGTSFIINQQLDISVKIRKKFMNLGYKVATVTPNYELAILEDTYCIQDYIDENNMVKSMLKLNAALYQISQKCDVIIFQMPSGIMKYNEYILGDLGIKSFAISNIIKPDYYIHSLTFNQYNDTYLQNIEEVVKKRFGCKISRFFVSNKRIDYSETRMNKRIQTFLVESDLQRNEYIRMKKISKYKFLNIYDDDDILAMIQEIEKGNV